jgi:hypothetical protein
MLRKTTIGFLLILFFLPLILILPLPVPPSPSRVLPQSVSVYAQVGRYYLESLSGWGSPLAEVTLTSQNLIKKTVSDEKGFFEFHSFPIPDQLGELCLISQDQHQYSSFPVCLAPPPGNQNIKIKDVLLPPTLSLEGSQIPNGKTAKASGMAFPSAEVDVYLFTENRFSLGWWWQNLLNHLLPVKSALAVGLPRYQVKTNASGYFEFSLPASFPSANRVYAAAIFSLPDSSKGFSPKSNTLAFETIGWLGWLLAFWRYFCSLVMAFFIYLKSHPSAIIIGELATLAGFVLFLVAVALSKKEDITGRKRSPSGE